MRQICIKAIYGPTDNVVIRETDQTENACNVSEGKLMLCYGILNSWYMRGVLTLKSKHCYPCAYHNAMESCRGYEGKGIMQS
jgi:hypothetical protein